MRKGKVLCPDTHQIGSPKDAFENLPTASSGYGEYNTVNLKAQQHLHIRANVRSHLIQKNTQKSQLNEKKAQSLQT